MLTHSDTSVRSHHRRHCATCNRLMNRFRGSNHCARCEAAGIGGRYLPHTARSYCPGCGAYPFKPAGELCHHCRIAERKVA